MDIKQRLVEIDKWEEILGRYTGVIVTLYENSLYGKQELIAELLYIQKCVISLKGIDDEDVAAISETIKELNG